MPTLVRRRDLLATVAALALMGTAFADPLPSMTLYKTPDCGCCEGYADYLRAAGFTVLTEPTNELSEISRRAGVPSGLQGCHTTLVGNYVVEGHVPVEAIHKLLAERPTIRGISLPGMPDGSPGMSGTKTAPFTVYAIGDDGKPSVFATI